MRVIPCIPNVEKKPGRSLHRRHLLDVCRRAPRQDRSRAIYRGMGKPRLGRSDQTRGDSGSLQSPKFPYDVRRHWIPRQRISRLRKLIRMRQVNGRRQERNSTDIGRADSLDNRKINYRCLGSGLRIYVGDRAI